MKNKHHGIPWLVAVGMASLLALGVTLATTTVVVNPGNMQDWFFQIETGTDGAGEMVNGPGVPPLGSGSARLATNDAATGVIIALPGFKGVRLDEITKLEYSTYRSAGGPAQGISLQFNIDNDLTDGDNTWKGRLVFEAYYSEPVLTGTWQTWNPMTQGRWWGTGAAIAAQCSQGSPCTWNQVLTYFPNAGIHNTSGGVGFKAGSNWAGFDGNVDAFTIGINGVETTYDFERNQAPVANAGPDQCVLCATAAATQVTLNGAGSSDPDGDTLTYSWTGNFPESPASGENPTVTLPLGTTTITLVVNDGTVSSAPDTVDVTVKVGVAGLQSPLAGLVKEGDLVPVPPRAFKRGSTLPLRLQLYCTASGLSDADVAPPKIVELKLAGTALDISDIDLDAGNSADGGLLFRYSGGNWVYNLSTKNLVVGTYIITIEMPDGLRYQASFVLK